MVFVSCELGIIALVFDRVLNAEFRVLNGTLAQFTFIIYACKLI